MEVCGEEGMAGREITLKNCRYVVRDHKVIEENIDILIEGRYIVDIGRGLGGGDEIDCREAIVLPGIVNAHTHAAMWIFRGLFDRGELHEWLKNVNKAEEKLTPRIVYLASKIAMLEMLSNGITAFVDMYYFPEETLKAVKETGIRAALGPVLTDEVVEEGESEKLVKSFIEKTKGFSRIKTVVNVRSLYSVSPETIREASKLTQKYDLDIHMHVSETRREIYLCKKRTGLFPVEYLNSLGVLNKRFILAHLGWVTSWELSLIKDKNASIVHCPASDMKLATAGFFPLRESLDFGINVGLGTDGAASNNSLDMFREMKVAVLLQRNNYWRTDIGERDVFRMAIENGYRILNIKGGVIEKNNVADLVLLDVKDLNLNPLSRRNVLSNIVYSANGNNVIATFVGGEIVYHREQKEAIYHSITDTLEEIQECINEIA